MPVSIPARDCDLTGMGERDRLPGHWSFSKDVLKSPPQMGRQLWELLTWEASFPDLSSLLKSQIFIRMPAYLSVQSAIARVPLRPAQRDADVQGDRRPHFCMVLSTMSFRV